VKIIADTNVLVRAFVDDDPAQSRAAKQMLTEAEAVVVSRHALCELAWVLGSTFRFSKRQIESLIRDLRDKENVITDQPAVNAGLAVMDAGGDFADGVIAFEGARLGGEEFVSFDKKAVDALTKLGIKSRLLKSLLTDPGK
jgi:predicted nucleic-acid-binding protein